MQSARMEPAQVIEALWARIEARDWAGVGELIDENVVIEWPATAERIIGRDNYVAVNREYPEGWSIRVLRIVADGQDVTSEVEVPHADLGIFRAASFWTVAGGRIARGTEYWTSVGADPSPDWRAPYVERL
jgi:ketosteroid isomerase-like protein